MTCNSLINVHMVSSPVEGAMNSLNTLIREVSADVSLILKSKYMN